MTGTSRDRDIIIEAIATYDDWMLDDDYDANLVLTRIIQKMRERIQMVDEDRRLPPSKPSNQQRYGETR